MDQVSSNASRSSFVTALAWVFIVLASFATLIAVLQNVMISIMMPASGMPPIGHQDAGKEIPAFVRLMFDNFRLLIAGFLVLSAVTLASAIGLLKRMNWARLAFLGLMGVGILWNVASVALAFAMFFSMPMPENTPADFRAQQELMSKVMTAFTVVMAVAFSALFAWIIKRLLSNDVRREFVAP